MKTFSEWNIRNNVEPAYRKPHVGLIETSKKLFGLSQKYTTNPWQYDNPLYKPGNIMHGESQYIDPDFMNEPDRGRGGGFISNTMGTRYQGIIQLSSTLIKPKTIEEQVLPSDILDLPEVFKKELKIDESTLLQRTKNENDLGTTADSRIYTNAPMDYNLLRKQPDHIQNFILRNVDDDDIQTNPKIDKLVLNLLKTRFENPLGLKKLTFDSIPGSKSVSESINKIIDSILTKNTGLPPGSLKSDDLKFILEGKTTTNPALLTGRQPNKDSTSFPGKFSDERHAYSLKYRGYYQFLGPGTHVKERKARGDVPINGLDQSAFVHDLEYQLFADTLSSGGTVTKQQVRASDVKLLLGLKKHMSDETLVASVAIAFINTKIRSEDMGILDYLYFVRNKNSSGQPIGL